ncbi:RNA-directed RNA polymerase 2 [Rhodotorula toruloides]
MSTAISARRLVEAGRDSYWAGTTRRSTGESGGAEAEDSPGACGICFGSRRVNRSPSVDAAHEQVPAILRRQGERTREGRAEARASRARPRERWERPQEAKERLAFDHDPQHLMSGYDDPYRHPRPDRRDESRFHGDRRDDRRGRGGFRRDDYEHRGYRDDRDFGGPRDGKGRGWDEDDSRDWKRGRYEDYDRPRGDTRSPLPRDDYRQPGYPTPPPPPHGQPYPGPSAYPQQAPHEATRPSPGAPAPRGKAPELEPPSASVILLGLPAHVTDTHLRNFLEDMGASIDSTTVIIDRATGLSKRFGFAKFSSVEHARAFVDPNFPSIPWRERGGPGPDDGMRIKINYSQKTGGWRDDQGASARLTEDQRKAEGVAAPGFYVNDGTRDIGSTPSNVILLRGLDPLTNEEEISYTLSRVGGRASQEIAKGGIKRIMIVKDRASRSSWGFAFAQFADVRLAKDVLAAAFNAQFHPTGFRIRNNVVAASFSHENSFVPIYSTSAWSFRGEGGAQLAYWDDKGFVQPWTPPSPPKTDEVMRGVPKAPRAVEEAKEKKGDLIISRKAAPNLAKWNQKSKELRSDASTGAAAAAKASSGAPAAAEKAKQPVLAQTRSSPAVELVLTSLHSLRPRSPPGATAASVAFDDPEFEHGDPVSFQCLLCQRQFKGIDELRKHNKLSQLHKARFAALARIDPCATRKAASVKKHTAAAASSAASTSSSDSSSKPKYVDRAAARREALGASDGPEHGQGKKRKFDGPEPPKPLPPGPNKDGLEESNAGRKMLEKMGWTTGAGLGASGSGRVDPVQAAQFAQGAGLGSTKGVAVGSEDGASKTYADRLREKALQRKSRSNFDLCRPLTRFARLAGCTDGMLDLPEVLDLLFPERSPARTPPLELHLPAVLPQDALDLTLSPPGRLDLVDSGDEGKAFQPLAAHSANEPDNMGRRPSLHRASTSYQSSPLPASPSPTLDDASFGVRSLAFGVFTSPSSFSAEWEREGKGVDKVWLETSAKEKKTSMVVRMWEEGSPFSTVPTNAASIRITVEIGSVETAYNSPGSSSLFLQLSRAATLGRLPAPSGSSRPRGRQIHSFDDAHGRPRHPTHLSTQELSTLLDRAVDEFEKLGQFLAEAEETQLIRQVTFTATRVLLFGPYLGDTNSIVRAYDRPELFVSVAVRHEDGSSLRERDDSLIVSRLSPLFRDGFELGGRSWRFLAWSSSGLKSSSCFFVSPFRLADETLVTPTLIHRSIGDFTGSETALIPAKYMARIAQAFSSSKPSLTLKPDQILSIEDITAPDGSCFSDGVGLISPSLASDVVEKLGIKLGKEEKPPTCFQFRLGGAKGMLQVDPTLEGKVVALRPSQVKFRSTLTSLEIAGTFEAGPGYLNRPLITLLENLGIPADIFLKLQAKATAKIRKSRASLPSAVKLLRDWSLASGTRFVSALGFLAKDPATRDAAFANPFVARCLDASVVHALRDIKYSARIPLPGCYNLVGVVDVDGCLAEDEIYARISRSDGSTEYLHGTIAISRSPTNHPGDCRIVRAVGKLPKGAGERIRGLTNCVVFPVHGSRSLPSMLAGGDLDGDVYLLLTEASGLVPSPDRIAEPAAYDAAPTVKLDREVSVEDGGEFFFKYITRDLTGLVATRQLLLADSYAEGLFHPDCLKLAQLHSDCVDAAKSGTFVPQHAVPRVTQRGWPDFLTNDAPDSYRSSKALGQLYRAIDEKDFAVAKPKSSSNPAFLLDIDPQRRLTKALESVSLPFLLSKRLKPPSRPLIAHYRAYLPSFSSELSKLLSLSPTPLRAGNLHLAEESLFLSVVLGTKRLQKSDKLDAGKRREQSGMLFAVVRKVIREGMYSSGRPVKTSRAVQNAWAAWLAAVEESEDRSKLATAEKKRAASGRRVGGATDSGRLLGLSSWAWLALGVMAEELERLEKENVEVLVVD